jgi:putative PIN family toxin of toxin-antitoxin system
VKVVLDTNTVISAIGWDGPPRRILLALRNGRHTLVTSPELLDEVTRVLRYPRLRPLAAQPLLPVILAWLHRADHIVLPKERVAVVSADPADNLVLDAAVAGSAEAVVSGDQHLLRLKSFRGIPILSAREFEVGHL